MAVFRFDKDPERHDGLHLYVYYVDSEDDINALPTSTKENAGLRRCAKGSLAVAYGDGDGAALYGLNGSDEWVKLRGL